MAEKKKLLESLNNTSISKIATKESNKNTDVDDAHNKEKIKQSENRTKIGQFFVNWAIGAITVITLLILFMTAFHIWTIVQDPLKLENTLLSIYNEIKLFVVKYQSVIAVIATLMFGDKLKSASKKATNQTR